jgi:hypothetical protein
MTKRVPGLLHVRSYLEWVEKNLTQMLEDNETQKYGKSGIQLPPAYVSNLRHMKIVARAIINKHTLKKTRKDIRLEAK